MKRQYKIRPLAEKLEQMSMPEPNSGCLLWLGAIGTSGYGKTSYRKKHLSAHRAAYEAFVGQIPLGMHVCHRCDVPLCINPAHLFLGTHAENMLDRDHKGRTLRHEKHPGAVIDMPTAAAIYAAPGTQREIGRLFGVDQKTVW